MKKLFVLSLGILLVAGSVVALASKRSNDDNDKPRQERVKLTADEKAQALTDRMAKAYDLTAEQKAKVLELNKRMLTRGQARPGDRPRQLQQAAGPAQPKADSTQRAPRGPKAQRGPRGGKQGKGFGRGFVYMKALKSIMTEEQFAAYCLDKRIERNIYADKGQRNFRHGGNNGFKGRGHGPAMRRNAGHAAGRPHHAHFRGQGVGPVMRSVAPGPMTHCLSNKRCADQPKCDKAKQCKEGKKCKDSKQCKEGKQCKDSKQCKEGKQCKASKQCKEGNKCKETKQCKEGKKCKESKQCKEPKQSKKD